MMDEIRFYNLEQIKLTTSNKCDNLQQFFIVFVCNKNRFCRCFSARMKIDYLLPQNLIVSNFVIFKIKFRLDENQENSSLTSFNGLWDIRKAISHTEF